MLALLVALMLPALGRARTAAKRVGCTSNLRQLHLSYMGYISDNVGNLYTIDYAADFATYGTPYRWDETVLDRYFTGGATRYFKDGCPDKGRHIPPFAPDNWSYGANGSVHAYVDNPAYYNTNKPARLVHFRRPTRTHLFSDMVQIYKRYPNPGFFDIYLLDRTFRHNHEGVGAVYADGRAAFEKDTEGPERIWNAMWHYAYGSCRTVGNGCFWHAYDSLVQ